MIGKLALGFGLAVTAAACEAPRGPDVGTGENQKPTEPSALAIDYPIVFSSNRAGPYDLHVMSSDASKVLPITRSGSFWVPRWSPAGDAVLFRRQMEGVDGVNAEVGVMSAGVRGLVLLTEGEDARQFMLAPNWSPDGTEVAYASLAVAADFSSLRLWKVPRTGGTPSRMFPDVEIPQRECAWSFPDGRYLAYTQGEDTMELWLSDTWTGDDATNISAGHVHEPVELAWSPDGSRLAMTAYALDADGNVEGLGGHPGGGPPPDNEIFVFDVETGEFTRVTDNAAVDYAPAWSPDGTSLLVTSDRDRDQDLDLWLVPLDAPEEARNLIDDSDNPRSDGLGHWFLGLP